MFVRGGMLWLWSLDFRHLARSSQPLLFNQDSSKSMLGHFQFELPVTGFIHHLQQQVAPFDGSVEQQLLGLKRRHHAGQRCPHRQPGETILEHGRLLGGSFHFDLGFHRLGLQLEFLIAVPLPRDIIPLRDQGRDQLVFL